MTVVFGWYPSTNLGIQSFSRLVIPTKYQYMFNITILILVVSIMVSKNLPNPYYNYNTNQILMLDAWWVSLDARIFVYSNQ